MNVREIDRVPRGVVALAPVIWLSALSVAGWSQSLAPPEGPAQIGRWLVESVWNQGDYRLANRMFTSSAVLHYRGGAIPLTEESGLRIVKNWRSGFPDFHFTIEDMIVEGNKVAMRIPFTGTHQGKFWGLDPTGRKIAVTETLIIRVENGRIAEMWEDYDELGMRMQLGLIQMK